MSGPDRKALETYFRLMNSNGAAQVYHTALEFGIFKALEQGPQSAAGVAQACGANEGAIALMLAALEALGLVAPKESLGYNLTDAAWMLLYSDYRELGNQYWRYLPTFLRTGEPLKRMDDPAESEMHYQAQAAMLGWMLSHAAEEAARKLEIGASRRGLSIVDIGAGSGIWSLTMARDDPQSRVTAVDWPAVLEAAQETAENFGVQERLTTIAGDFHKVTLPAQSFDLAIVANVTHLQTPEANASLIRKLHAALKAQGEIVIIDALPGGPQAETPLALYQLGLALRTQNGCVYSPDELTAMLGDLFESPTIIPLEAPPHMVGMLTARKAAHVGNLE
jgi:ubiquinone/menaquinone biosynthesis C-methylase UbiE